MRMRLPVWSARAWFCLNVAVKIGREKESERARERTSERERDCKDGERERRERKTRDSEFSMCVLLVCMLCEGVLHTYLHMYTHDQQHTYALSIPVTGREPIPKKNFFLSNSPSVVGGTNTRKEFSLFLIFS